MNFTGTNGGETLTGTLGDDVINALGGSDTINATRGADVVDGGAGTDRLTIVLSNAARFAAATGPRNYYVTASTATDSSGELNTSFINIERLTLDTRGTGSFNDTIDVSGFVSSVGNIAVNIFTGGGDDTVIGSAVGNSIATGLGSNIVDAGGGEDYVYCLVDNRRGLTQFVTSVGSTVVTTVGGVVTNQVTNAEYIRLGGSYTGMNYLADGLTTTVDGSGFAPISGVTLLFDDHNGDDIFIGSSGADIFGNTSTFTVGDDTYTGNGGADVYDYTVAIGSMDGDRITDLDGDDVIDFQYNNPALNNAGQLADKFIGSAAFTGIAGQYRYYASGGQTFVQADINGDMVADETLTISNGQFALGETFAGSNILQIIGTSGTAAGEFMVGTRNRDFIYAQGGNDTVAATQGMDFVDGGDGIDQIRFVTSNLNRFDPANGSRVYTITSNWVGENSGTIDTYFANFESLFLNTTLNGDFGDTIDASAYDGPELILLLGNGNDTVIGSAVNDNITTGLGINTVDAGAGYDMVISASNQVDGDTIYVTNSGGALVTTLNGVVTNNVSNAELVGIQGYNFNVATTTIDASAVTGFAGQLVFFDNNGTNIAIGSVGSDVFANVHGGEAGDDVYTGNGGVDVYDYTYAIGSMDRDTITDFDADDVIDIRFNNATQNGGGLIADKFIGSAAFSGVAGQYRYYTSGGQTFVQVDTNGDTVTDETLTIANGEFGLVETAAGSNMLARANLIYGTAAADILSGTISNDVIIGLGGGDNINASGGVDAVDGGGANDRLTITLSNTSRFGAATGSRDFTITSSSRD